jgi:hypothetical protein
MSELLRSLTVPHDDGVVRISKDVSARVAQANPGPGIPISALTLDARVQLTREGLQTSLKDFVASTF